MGRGTNRRWAAALMILAAAALVGGCGGGTDAEDGRPVVAATIHPLADLTRQVAGEAARVVCLVPPGTSPHGFEPSAEDAEALARAELLVAVGANFDTWAFDALRRHGAPTATALAFDLAAGLEPSRIQTDTASPHGRGEATRREAREGPEEKEQGHEGSNGAHEGARDHPHGPANPHLWLDPVLARKFVGKLGERLAARLPDHAADIRRRAEQLAAELKALHADYQKALAELPRKELVTFHSAFDRLAARYGLRVVATLSPVEAPGTLTGERLERAIRAIEAHGVRTVFAEPQFPPDSGRVLQRETGVAIRTLDPMGDPQDPQRDTYQRLMRYNLEQLVAGLGGRLDAETPPRR